MKKLFPIRFTPLSIYLIIGLLVVNILAIFSFDPLHILSLASFIYILVTPGFLILPLFTKRQFPFFLGITLSVSLSILMLMVMGLGLNYALPLLELYQPLSTVPLLISFDLLTYMLMVLNFIYKENSPFEYHGFDSFNWGIIAVSTLLPVLACLGTTELNDGGSNLLAMTTLGISILLVICLTVRKEKVNQTSFPIALYMMAAAFLLMNSMRGWYITGHDILLEYHIFEVTNQAHFWDIAGYRDPYTACLSITILPTYIQELIHINSLYIYKFFLQFIGAFAVIPIYYLSKKYTTESIAFIAGYLYVSFPTFLVDMAFLNRQGIGFLFFGMMIYILFSTEYFEGHKREIVAFLLGIGMVISHYSTSYVGVALLIITYVIALIMRIVVRSKYPRFLARLTSLLPNRSVYEAPVLLSFIFVVGILLSIFVWANLITQTSSNLSTTLDQIVLSIEHPFSWDDYSGADKYSLTQSQETSPQQLLNEFVKETDEQTEAEPDQSNLFSPSVTDQYQIQLVNEPLVPLSNFGYRLQAITHINLVNFYTSIKQVYAKFLQVLLLIGLIGVGLGYSFRKTLTSRFSVEYIALCAAGIVIMVGQTVLPSSAINYGLLRLFQQNLIFLSLPIVIGLIYIFSILTRNHKTQLLLSIATLLFFFCILSGFISQLTGGARAPLPLDNYGFYYDAYYTHTQEVYAIQWLSTVSNNKTPVQSDHYFSNIKLIAYGGILPIAGLLPETIQKNSYVYLNATNAQTGDIIEFVNGDMIYYHFPMSFLNNEKNLIYNNGGSMIYR